MITVPLLCNNNYPTGEISGICCICGESTKTGYILPFSENFTGYEHLVHGNCSCANCYGFIKEPSYRKRSWVATAEEVLFFKRLEFMQWIANPPTPPFFMYLTKSGKRQGWLSSLRTVNYSRDKYFIATDWLGIVWTNQSEVRQLRKIIWELREKKVSKTELLTGKYSMMHYKQAINDNCEDLLKMGNEFVKKPIWELLVYVSK